MARIVSGTARGRRLRVPQRGTRPTTERVRESLFNALEAAGEVVDATVLDLYAGSGALGLEALSRGAADVYFVEEDRKAVAILRRNVAEVGLGGTVRHATVAKALACPAAVRADLVLVDPPYAVTDAQLRSEMAALAAGGWVGDGGLVIIERSPPDGEDCWPPGFDVIRVQRYRDTTVYWAEYRPGETG
ncbi:16S rRNA (guanine(966)-N(2))-methyltransferase RsmD [Haloechinothrix sp. LS1_15]|uniref:16S rRNA (guanine(966)-N(2))-methyltransferase RsmD n=1 Tax=Haloechinothrix sp. LS1_15 TaxID=2652248 RepID=UPI002944624B|nr:16S rRNA (guanine(966)-N(2))-methyltransferase RsmD [Haloechinothrix sp. LS1_15]MDV6012856.1 16S rRNA (guanine(966)-N(2))-methyltransferase RsmD [Haloechinothrix sp. LS1_15]